MITLAQFKKFAPNTKYAQQWYDTLFGPQTEFGSALAISCTRCTSALYCIFCCGVGSTILLYCSFRSFNTSLTSPAAPLMSL